MKQRPLAQTLPPGRRRLCNSEPAVRCPGWVCCAVAGLVFAGLSPNAAASDVQIPAQGEPPGGPSSPAVEQGRWSLDAGAGVLLSQSTVEERYADLVGISEFGLVELALSASYRMAKPVSLGARASWGTELGQRGIGSPGDVVELDRSLSQISLGARYQALRGRSLALGVDAGAAAIADSIGNASVTQWAPVVAASVGYDFRLASELGLGLELRASHAWFSESGQTVIVSEETSRTATTFRYGSTTWVGLHLLVHWLP